MQGKSRSGHYFSSKQMFRFTSAEFGWATTELMVLLDQSMNVSDRPCWWGHTIHILLIYTNLCQKQDETKVINWKSCPPLKLSVLICIFAYTILNLVLTIMTPTTTDSFMPCISLQNNMNMQSIINFLFL